MAEEEQLPPGCKEDHSCCGCCCDDDCECYRPVPDERIDWPKNNKIGNCLCGHDAFHHDVKDKVLMHEAGGHCDICQCVLFALDRWGTIIV